LHDELSDVHAQLAERDATISKLSEELRAAIANSPAVEPSEPPSELNALWSALRAAQADAASERSARAEALVHVESLRARISAAEGCRDAAVAEIAEALHAGISACRTGGGGSEKLPGEEELVGGPSDAVAVAMRVRRVAERVATLDAQLEAAQRALQQAQNAACEVCRPLPTHQIGM
jgi:DNA repair exonuclease SbcCD ATPase subunit